MTERFSGSGPGDMEITERGRDDSASSGDFGDVPSRVQKVGHDQRLRRVVDTYIAFVGRLLRNMGIVPSDIDDAVQQVFLTVSAKLDRVEPERERAFLFGVALRTAARLRRNRGRRREVADEQIVDLVDPKEGPDQLSHQRRARVLLDDILANMDADLRAVFALYEVEELTMAEIAEILELPPGTVASRLRRAREQFGKALKRLQAREPRGAP